MGRRYLVRFLLEAGHSLDIMLLDVEANSLVKNWDPEPPRVVKGVDSSGRHYSFHSSRVQAVFSVDEDTLKRQQEELLRAQQAVAGLTRPQQPMNRPMDFGSGNN